MYRITVALDNGNTASTQRATIAECLSWYAERCRPEFASDIKIERIDAPAPVNYVDQGYRAQATGARMEDNPYGTDGDQHWEWRKGYLEAFKDSH